MNDRKARGQKAKKAGGLPPVYKSWRFPSSEPEFVPWLNALYRIRFNWVASQIGSLFHPDARGKKLTKIINEHIMPLRHKIAHSIFGETGGDFWEESLEYHNEIEEWLPVGQMIVRRMLKDEFPGEFLVGLQDLGIEDLCKNPT